MSGKRRYADGCAVAQGLDLIGERWALLVVRELMFGPRRFSDLRSDLPGIATNILSQRLTDLAEAGIVVKLPPEDGARGGAYDLTEWGRELAPMFKVLGRWAFRSPLRDPMLPLSPSAAVLSLTALFRPQKARGRTLTVGLSLDGRGFTAEVAERRLTVRPGLDGPADAIITGSAAGVFSLLTGQETGATDTPSISGNRAAIEELSACFRQPPAVTAVAAGAG